MATDSQQAAYARAAFTLADLLRRERARRRPELEFVAAPSLELVSAVKQFGDEFVAATIPPADVVSQLAQLAAAALPELRAQPEPPRQLALHLVAACYGEYQCDWCRTALGAPRQAEELDERDVPGLEAFQRALETISCPVHGATPQIVFRGLEGSIQRFDLASCCEALHTLVLERYAQELDPSDDH